MDSADLRHVMAELGWTAGDLAERLGVHRNTVSRWRSGGSVPKFVAAYLDIVVRVREAVR